MSNLVLGIDVGKVTLAVCARRETQDSHKEFVNNNKGHKELLGWIRSLKCENIEVYLEATGKYGTAVCDFLYGHNCVVKVINPLQIKSFARTKLSRHKTDKVDAALIAEYGCRFKAVSYKPLASNHAKLRDLYRCSLEIKEQISLCTNYLENKEVTTKSVVRMWQRVQKNYEAELKRIMQEMRDIIKQDQELSLSFDLLTTIDGVAEITATAILAELPDLQDFSTARSLAAFYGLTPRHHRSGTSVRGRSRISRMGNGYLRKALFFPAMVILQRNGVFRKMKEKMQHCGKKPKVIICAMMRKLVHIIYAVLKHKQAFSPEKFAVAAK